MAIITPPGANIHDDLIKYTENIAYAKQHLFSKDHCPDIIEWTRLNQNYILHQIQIE